MVIGKITLMTYRIYRWWRERFVLLLFATPTRTKRTPAQMDHRHVGSGIHPLATIDRKLSSPKSYSCES